MCNCQVWSVKWIYKKQSRYKCSSSAILSSGLGCEKDIQKTVKIRVHVSYIFRSGVRDRYPEDDPDGEIPAVRHGPDRGPVQVCLHGRASLPGNGAATQAGRGGLYIVTHYILLATIN